MIVSIRFLFEVSCALFILYLFFDGPHFLLILDKVDVYLQSSIICNNDLIRTPNIE